VNAPTAALHPVVRAALWMTGSLASFTLMAIAAREVSRELTTFQILFFRSLVGLPIVLFLVWRTDWQAARTARFGTHVVRNVCHYGGQWGWFVGVAVIPLAEVFALEFTAPIWTAIAARLILGERITPVRAFAIALGFAGMLVMLRPGAGVMHPAAFAVLAGALSYGVAHTFTRKLTRTDGVLTILFWMMILQLPMGLVPSLFDWRWPTSGAWPWVVMIGLTALTAHFCMTRAFSLADVTVVIPMDFLRLPIIAIVAWALYGEGIAWPVAVGAALVVLASFINIQAERRKPAAPVDSAKQPAPGPAARG
jgi:drug/metabolite transporter (DMT)-like permease